MTELLEKAFSEASKLPLATQDALAARLLKDIESEERWDDSFAATQDELAHLADEALEDFKQGRTKPFDEVL